MANMLMSGEEKSILVAGQALAVWGVYYLDKRIPLDQLSPLTSRDIDFYNKRATSIAEYAEHVRSYLQDHGLHLSTYHVTMTDHTPNTAKWYIHDDSNNGIGIDFLDYLSGLSREEIERNADEISIGDKAFLILSPVFCLKARINNLLILYPSLGKSKERIENEEERVKLGIQIVKYHLQEMHYWPNPETQKIAMKRTMQVIKLAKSSLGRQLYKTRGISVLDAIPLGVFDDRFYQHTLTNAAKKLGIV